MNTLELDLLGGDEAELTSLVSAFVEQNRRLPGYDDLVTMRARPQAEQMQARLPARADTYAPRVHCGDHEATHWVA
jgi:hypothetical protein